MTATPPYQKGDLVFCHSSGFVAWTIRVMQRIRSPKDCAHWNHVAILWEYDSVHDEWWIIQAAGRGVQTATMPPNNFEVVACPVKGEAVVDFAHSQLGVKYGFLTIASIVLNIITPKILALRKPHTWICSALAAGALWYAGWNPSEEWWDLYQVSPADLYGRLR